MRRLIPGPVLLGFAEIFDEAWGKPAPNPPRVTPSKVGEVLLPFPCPHCSAARPEPVDPRRRSLYEDPGRGFSFCPVCLGRYVVDRAGVPLLGELPRGATSAPARVERGGRVEIARETTGGPFDLIGAEGCVR